ncbi:hypothetical protein ACOARS_11995, partial [Glaesserella parasuis]|uniref:hypothetical protein n=1 Tax=Glaesserella parasuis TaxID=738 RepID=UPI003B806674
AAQNVSAVLQLPGGRLVLHPDGTAAATFADSILDADAVTAWRQAPRVERVTPVGIAQGRAEGPDGSGGVALFGLDAGAGSTDLAALAPPRDDEVGLSAGAAAALGASVGDDITVAGTTYRVASVGGDAWYSHTPVVALTPTAWTALDTRLGGTGEAT